MAGTMFLFRGGVLNEDDVAPEEMQQHMQKWQAWIGRLAEQGIYEGGQPLQPGGLVVSDGVVSDGPFPESKEMVAGFFTLDVENLEQAAEIAKDCPIFEYGGRVEVRQIFAEHSATERATTS